MHTNNIFSENRLVMQDKPSPSAKFDRHKDDSFFESPTAEDPAEAAKREAKHLMDARQEKAFEDERERNIINTARNVFRMVKQIEQSKKQLNALERKNPSAVALRVATDMLLNTADGIGARGKGVSRIRKPRMYVSGTMSAMVDSVVQHLLYNDYLINDVTDASQFDRIESTIRHEAERGNARAGWKVPSKYHNRMARLTSIVERMKDEFA